MRQIILFYQFDCFFCKMYLSNMKFKWYFLNAGIGFRTIWIHGHDPLLKRYERQIGEVGVPLLVVENYTGTKVVAEGVVGMTTRWFAEGMLQGLKDFLVGIDPAIGDHL